MPLRISSRSCPDVIAIAHRYRESRQALDINRHSSPHSISCYPDSRAVQHPALPCQSPSAPNTSFSFPLRSQSTPPQSIIPPRLFSPSLLANDYVPEQRLRGSRSLQHSSHACHTQLFAPSSRHALPAPSSPRLPLSLVSRVLKHPALPCQSHSLPPPPFPATLTPSNRPPSSPCISLYSTDLRTAATHLQQAQVGLSYCISSSHTPRASRSTHPFLQLLVGKGSEARQNAAADLAALVGPLAAGKRLIFSATSSSSAAAGTSGGGGAGGGDVQWEGGQRRASGLVGAARKVSWSVALFGAPSDGRTSKVSFGRQFDLAFEVILHLPAVQILASVAASLAEKQHRVLFEGQMDQIKHRVLPPADMDEVIGAALMVYTHTAVKLSNLSLTFTGRQDMSRS
ncbi:unnamed protein product, partial [Closterium sp. Naga37s-1]